MSRTVFCRLYQQELEGLESAPVPGAKGEDIFLHISKQAWQDWQTQQTRLINEKRLNMMDKEHRAYLSAQRDRFFSGQTIDQADGYVPENKDK